MSNDKNPTSPEDFDLFANPVDNHLAEELAKGTFSWTNKYTKILGVLTVTVALLSVGAWYGHHSATSSSTTNVSSLRSTFARFASSGGFGGGSGGGSSFGGGSGGGSGGGFGVRITGSIAKVSGSTVTITLTDPTQAASLKAGDNARITDTGAAGAPGASTGGFAGGASAAGGAAGGFTGGPAAGGTGTSASKSGMHSGYKGGASGAAGSTASTGAPAGAPAGGSPAGSSARGGGMFSNPALTACLTKAGVTITPGQRPNFQDPTTMTALQGCMKSLGLSFGGGGGGAGGGFAGRSGGASAGAAAGAGAPATSGAPATTNP